MNPSLRIVTALSPEEAVNRLTHALDNQPAIRVSPTLTMRKQIVDGHVSESRIHLFVCEGLANSYTAHFSGKFSEADGRTILEGEFHHAPMIRLHLAMMRGFAIALAVAMSVVSLYGLFTTGQLGLVLGVVIPLAFTMGVFRFVPGASKLETGRLDKFIRSAIESK